MLYTTYISKIKDIPSEARKIIVMRYMPKSLKDPKYNLEWNPHLAPPDIILNKYKSNAISFSDLLDEFDDYLNTNKLVKQAVDNIKKDLIDNKDVYLICCEKNHFECHRSNLLKYICNGFGYEGGEMK
jgi:uncharacterized protein YeaO (DUF488 family)